MDPILLNFFDNEINAIDIKDRLDEAGIECVLQNELKTQVNVLAEPTEYGVAVYVDKKDYSEAKSILESYEQEFEDEQELEDESILCPECESGDLTVSIEHVKPKISRIFLYALVLAVGLTIYNLAHHNGEVSIGRLIGGFIGAVIGAIIGGFIERKIKSYDKTVYHCNKCGKDFSEEDRY